MPGVPVPAEVWRSGESPPFLPGLPARPPCTILAMGKGPEILPQELLAVTSSFLNLAKDIPLPPGVSGRTGINTAPQPASSFASSSFTTCPAQQLPSCLSPAAMPLCLLWLGLTLLGALQTQAQDSTPNLIPAPPLSRVPLQPNFQDDQVRNLAGQLWAGPPEQGEQKGVEVEP